VTWHSLTFSEHSHWAHSGCTLDALWAHLGHTVSTFQSLPNSCRTPQDSAGLQAKVLILVASPAKLGRAQQSLAGLSAKLGRTWQRLAGLDRIQTELCRIYFKLEYITKKQPVMIYLYTNIHSFIFVVFVELLLIQLHFWFFFPLCINFLVRICTCLLGPFFPQYKSCSPFS
jgi:hypothetical protein